MKNDSWYVVSIPFKMIDIDSHVVKRTRTRNRPMAVRTKPGVAAMLNALQLHHSRKTTDT